MTSATLALKALSGVPSAANRASDRLGVEKPPPTTILPSACIAMAPTVSSSAEPVENSASTPSDAAESSDPEQATASKVVSVTTTNRE